MKRLVPPGGYLNEEAVNHPPHYNSGKTEVIDIIDGLGYAEGFCIGNIIKYVSRFQHKNGIEDLEKAKWYIDYLIKRANLKANND